MADKKKKLNKKSEFFNEVRYSNPTAGARFGRGARVIHTAAAVYTRVYYIVPSDV